MTEDADVMLAMKGLQKLPKVECLAGGRACSSMKWTTILMSSFKKRKGGRWSLEFAGRIMSAVVFVC